MTALAAGAAAIGLISIQYILLCGHLAQFLEQEGPWTQDPVLL